MGYIGKSQSERAEEAKQNGEWPISHCQRIIKEESGINFSTDFLKDFYNPSSWHHTGKDFKRTDFYQTHVIIEDILNNNLVQEFVDYSERNGIKVNEKSLRKKEAEFKENAESVLYYFIDKDSELVHFGRLKGLELKTDTGIEIKIQPDQQGELKSIVGMSRYLNNINTYNGLSKGIYSHEFEKMSGEDKYLIASLAWEKNYDKKLEIIENIIPKETEEEKFERVNRARLMSKL